MLVSATYLCKSGSQLEILSQASLSHLLYNTVMVIWPVNSVDGDLGILER